MKLSYWYLLVAGLATAALAVNLYCYFHPGTTPALGNASLSAAVLVLAARLFFRA